MEINIMKSYAYILKIAKVYFLFKDNKSQWVYALFINHFNKSYRSNLFREQ